ncbi:glycosyl hydrolase [Enterococcus alcedinis]|uniref:Glycosyl hydrolase n=2 Tax=Enterococcus alcedinis TaxID=1274384 RepID=A0A917N3X8_9ENTE|nr:glycosyltransferase family 2 protein [Enterococcus alcedinis]MBP2101182.1 glycosyltransferase involved in cell wall biosynthesis [Enterococcus alcedinis]GGI64519.1 glycosyl hydrolase [Enterococcus alcedinis]
MKKITILTPMYNEQENIPHFYDQVNDVIKSLDSKYTFEFLFINDGSTDYSLEEVIKLQLLDTRVKYVDLSRNYGKEIAMLAGMDYAKGDAVIIMDSDLQHPPEVIPKMIHEWENGFHDVYGKRVTRHGEGFIKKKISNIYYRILGMLSEEPVLPNVGDFRLLDRVCVDSIVRIRESQRYTKGLYMWIGFDKKEIEFEANERFAGETKWRLKNLVTLAVDGIISNSNIPLRFSFYTGFILSFIGFSYMLYTFISALFWGNDVQGYPTIVILILLSSGFQFLFLSIIGEYVGKIFKEVKNRPVYFTKKYSDNKTKKTE